MKNYPDENILSLDLGTSSAGWAIINPFKEKIYHTGVNIFPEGVKKEQGNKEKSRTQDRREARGQRKNIFRKKYMQIRLQRELIKFGVFPMINELIDTQEKREKLLDDIIEYYKPILTLQDDFDWSVKYLFKKFKFSASSNDINFQVGVFRILQDYGFMKLNEASNVWFIIQRLISFFSMDPYKLRNDAVKEDPKSLTKLEFGRILYHLSQLRGFSSNRTDSDLLENKEKEKKDLEEDAQENTEEKKDVKLSKDERINKLWTLVEKYNCKTYGQFFYLVKQGLVNEKEKVRGERDTSREKYREEFGMIWDIQKEKGSDEIKRLLSDNSLRRRIEEEIIYFQRPLKSQKGLIGKCKLESHRIRFIKDGKEILENRGKPRCPVSALPFERYIMLSEINNMFIVNAKNEKITIDDYRSMIEEIYYTKSDFGIREIAKTIGLKAGWFIKGKLDNSFHPDDKAFETLKNTLGNQWGSLKESKQNNLWINLYFCIPKDNQTEAEAIAVVLKKEFKSVSDGIIEKYSKKLAEVFPCKGDIKIYGCQTHIYLQKIFGKQLWNNDWQKQNNIYPEHIWQIIFQYRTTTWQGKDETLKKQDWLIKYAEKYWKVNTDEQKKYLIELSKKIKTGYGNLSRHAINNILPYLEVGKNYTYSVFFGNLHKVFKNLLNQKSWDEFEKENRIIIKLETLLQKEYPSHYRKSSIIFECWKHIEEFGIEGIEQKIKKEMKRHESITPDEKTEIEKKVKEISELKKQNNTISPKYYKTKSKGDFIIEFLKKEFPKLKDDDLKKLYHPSLIEKYPKSQTGFLENPDFPGLKNPVVLQTLHEVKHLVNAIIKASEKDETYKVNRVRIEVSRELNDKNKRIAYRRWQQANEKENNNAKKKIEECVPGIKVTSTDILKYRLWQEMIAVGITTCPYCKGKIYSNDELKGVDCVSISKLFKENPDYNIDHIIPEEISCDSTMENLILCCKKCNQEIKRKKMPSELDNYEVEIKNRVKGYRNKAFGLKTQIENKTKAIRAAESDKEKQDKLKQERERLKLERIYYETKYRNLTATKDDLEKRKFKERQLPDTGFITKYALAYLKTVFPIVEAVKGKATDNFRKEWSLQSEDEKKDRSQHLHHAIDACIIGCLDKRIYDRYAEFLHNQDEDWNRPKFSLPWKDFVKDVKDKTSEILVYYRKKERNPLTTWNYIDRKTGKVIKRVAVRGELHNALYFGKSSENEFTQRGYLNELTLAGYSKIKDERLRYEIIKTIIEKTGTTVFKTYTQQNNGKTIFVTEYNKNVFKGKEKEKSELEKKIKTEILPNGFYDSVTQTIVKKVKILEQKKNIEPLYGLNKWVETANNYGALVYKDLNEYKHQIIPFFKVVKEHDVLTFIDERHSNKEIFLQNGDMFILGLNDVEFKNAMEKKDNKKLHLHLYNLRGISSQTNNPSNPFYEFHLHTEAKECDNTSDLNDSGALKKIEIKGFGEGKTGWLKWNPIKVKIDRLGNIKLAMN